MENILLIIIQLISGAAGGTVAGSAIKDLSLGTIGNFIAGMFGGGIGGQLTGLLSVAIGTGFATDSIDGIHIGYLLQSAAGAGVGGMTLLVLAGAIKLSLGK
jgi:hypothetical protein